MINVVCAVIEDAEGRVLVCQRSVAQPHPGKWEFPGGKVKPGEDGAEALQREISEELGCEIQVGEVLPVVEHDYPNFSIRLMPYRCSLQLLAKPEALEHETIRWVSLAECVSLDWAEADIPIWQGLIGRADV